MDVRGGQLAPAIDPGRHEWQRLLPVWHLGFALLALITAALSTIDDGTGAGRRYAVLVCLIVLSGWYAAVGVRALERESERLGLAYLTVAGPMVLTLFALRPVGAFMLFVLYPHIWMLLPLRRAVAGTVAALATVAVVMIARSGVHPRGLLEAFVLAAVGLLVALLLGTWIAKVVGQSQLRARLVTELSATRAELATVSHDAGVLAERERLAREVHDTLAQGFTSILILLDAMESELATEQKDARRHLELARHSARENLAEARALIAAAGPVHLQTASFPEAVARLVELVGHETSISARHTVVGRYRTLPAGHEAALLRVLQQSLANAGTHAHATGVEVCVSYHDDRVTLEVRDDGQGFDEASTSAGFGMTGMRRRVEQAGGTFRIRGSAAGGTVVGVEVPYTVAD